MTLANQAGKPENQLLPKQYETANTKTSATWLHYTTHFNLVQLTLFEPCLLFVIDTKAHMV